MSSPTDAHGSARADRPARGGAGRWLLLGLAFLLVLLLVPILYQQAHEGRIYPGVYVGPVNVGRMTAEEAASALRASAQGPGAPVRVNADGREWSLAPDAASYDVDASVAAAYALGRDGGRGARMARMLALRFRPQVVRPAVEVDEALLRAELERVAAEIAVAPRNAELTLSGTHVKATDPVDGQALDVEEAVGRIAALARLGTWPIGPEELKLSRVPPEVSDAAAAFALARHLLSAPLELTAEGRTYALPPESLARAMTTRTVDGSAALDIDPVVLGELLADPIEELEVPPREPRFHYDDASGRLLPVDGSEKGAPGLRVDVEATARRIRELGLSDERRVAIAVEEQPPLTQSVSDASELGIDGLLHEETSYFRGSSAARVHNIGLAASKFDGVLIPPGRTVSFNELIGDISEEVGYEETLIILDGATADGVGGGVCQVSTTLYRAAWWTGMPIVERLAHGYRVGYYEQNAPTGMDATIFRPYVDLKFDNDSEGYLLIETETDPANASLTFRFYGKDSGRVVEMEGPEVSDVTQPPPAQVEVDLSLPPGASETVELSRTGSTVRVTRIVTEPDGEERREDFVSRYEPTGALTKVGPDPAPAPQGLAGGPALP